MTRTKFNVNSFFGWIVLGALFIITSATFSTMAQDPDQNNVVGKTDADGSTTTAKASKKASSSSDWTGFYVGGYAGGTFGRAKAQTSTVFSGYFQATSVPVINTTGAQTLKPRGFTGGGTAGYNYQSGHFLIGGEVDFGGMDLKKDMVSTATYPCCAPTAFTINQSIRTKWLFTARPRVGFTAGNALIYGTAGLALTDINYQALFTDTFAAAHENGGFEKTKAGWTVGGGAEFKVGNKWSVKGEYIYADFRRETTTSSNFTVFAPPVPFPNTTLTHSTDLQAHSVRFGINYHF